MKFEFDTFGNTAMLFLFGQNAAEPLKLLETVEPKHMFETCTDLSRVRRNAAHFQIKETSPSRECDGDQSLVTSAQSYSD